MKLVKWHEYAMCMQVGPLPLGPDADAMPMYADGEINWHKRPDHDKAEAGAWVITLADHHQLLI